MEYKGIKFDSKMECDYYKEVIEELGDEFEIHLQPKYELFAKYEIEGKKVRAINYIADFAIINKSNSTIKIIDIKGFETADFKIKKKMFERIFLTKIHCITRAPKYYEKDSWIELDELKKIRKERKKLKESEVE